MLNLAEPPHQTQPHRSSSLGASPTFPTHTKSCGSAGNPPSGSEESSFGLTGIRDARKGFRDRARLIADVSRDLGMRGASDGVLDALTTAADGLDYGYPLKWQPNAIQIYFDLTARALRQMKP